MTWNTRCFDRLSGPDGMCDTPLASTQDPASRDGYLINSYGANSLTAVTSNL